MSIRTLAIEAVITVAELELELMDMSSNEDEDEIMDDLYETVLMLVTSRYLQSNDPIPKSKSWLNEILTYFDENRFRAMLRVSPSQFIILLELLEENPIFHTNTIQLSPAVQLSIVLFRLGSYGNGCSMVKMATLFGIGDGGTIHRVTARVFQAILGMEKTYIRWPSNMERETIVDEIGERLPKCIGFLDGSEFNLCERPALDHSSYYSRKQRYSIKAQTFCDYELRILHLHVGFPGSAHDSRMFNHSYLCGKPAKYFRNSQWLAADSAYKLTNTVITPFRKNSTFKSKQQRDKFNKDFSSFRVKIENCFSILKGKFTSLKELRTRIKDQNTHAFVCCWIRVCVILHNILLPYYDDEDKEFQPNDEEEDGDDGRGEDAGANKRAALFSLLEHRI